MNRIDTISLRLATWMPFLYLANLALGSLLYPGFSQSRQMVSELGSKGAPHPGIFNVGIVVIGISILVSAFGYFRALQFLKTNLGWLWLTTSILFLSGVATLLAGIYPWPDPRHDGKYLGLVIILGPISLAAAMWNIKSTKSFSLYLLAASLVMIIMLAILIGAGGLATPANVGVYQRIYALAAFPWIGAGAYVLKKQCSQTAPASELV